MNGCDHPQIPALTAPQMAEVDHQMTDELGIALVQMMKLAGRGLATLARDRFLDGDPRAKRITVLAGSGGNGGGGMVAARRLHGWCAEVDVWLTRTPEMLTGAAAHQLHILRAIGVSVHAPDETLTLPPADLLLDAVVGYSLAGAPRGRAAELITAANDHQAPVLSLDVPSGLEATTGQVCQPCVQAAATMTLALPKTGLWALGAQAMTGAVYLADIGVPETVYTALDLEVGPIFARQDLFRIG